jgi:hypothetical protein
MKARLTLFADGYAPVLPPRLQVTSRVPPEDGQWSQWEAIWRKTDTNEPS